MNSVQLSFELRKAQQHNNEQDIFLNGYLQIVQLVRNRLEIRKYRSLQVQIDKFLMRPMILSDLKQIVRSVERLQSEPAAQRKQLDSRMLVADDDAFVSLVIDNILQEFGCEQIVAHDGMQAWRILDE